MKTETFRNGAHRAIVTTSHKGEWIKLKITNGHEDIEITLKPEQAGVICANLNAEMHIVSALRQREKVQA